MNNFSVVCCSKSGSTKKFCLCVSTEHRCNLELTHRTNLITYLISSFGLDFLQRLMGISEKRNLSVNRNYFWFYIVLNRLRAWYFDWNFICTVKLCGYLTHWLPSVLLKTHFLDLLEIFSLGIGHTLPPTVCKELQPIQKGIWNLTAPFYFHYYRVLRHLSLWMRTEKSKFIGRESDLRL